MSRTLRLSAPLIFLVAFNAHANGPRNRCHVGMGLNPKDTAVVNVGFDSYDEMGVLQGVSTDLGRFQKISAGRGSSNADITSKTHGSKSAFLAKIKATVAGKKSVMFNYAGHGALLKGTSDSMLILPGFPVACAEELEKSKISVIKKVSPPGINCSDFYVSAAELREIFGNRKVYGINDSCHSGGFDLGSNSAVMYSARANEVAQDGGAEGGLLAREIDKVLAEKACETDLNDSGTIDYNELFAAIPTNRFPVRLSTSPNPQGLSQNFERVQTAFQAGEEQRGLGRTNRLNGKYAEPSDSENPEQMHGIGDAYGWMQCVRFGAVRNGDNCRESEVAGRLRRVSARGVNLRDVTYPEAPAVCQLGPNDFVRTTGRSSGNGFVQVEVVRSKSSTCRRGTGWVAEDLMRTSTFEELREEQLGRRPGDSDGTR